MPRTLVLPGQLVAQWYGVTVWQGNDGYFQNITNTWNWSADYHQHYEVMALGNGSYWVPVSTHPPAAWRGATKVIGTQPIGSQPVNPSGMEYRPDTTYIWIPNSSIPLEIIPGNTSNWVDCKAPNSYPPPLNMGSQNTESLTPPQPLKNT